MAQTKNGKQTVSASEIINAAFKNAKSETEIAAIKAKLQAFIADTAKKNADALKPEKKTKAAPKKAAKTAKEKKTKMSKEEYIAQKIEKSASKELKVKGVEVPKLTAADGEKISKLDIRMVPYSDKAFFVYSETPVRIGEDENGKDVEVGATTLLRSEFIRLGGSYNNFLKGWFFSKARSEKAFKEAFGNSIKPMTKKAYEKAVKTA